MNGSLVDAILEMGYSFTSSIENCRNAFLQFDIEELQPSILARMLSAMIKTLKDHTPIIDNEKNSIQTWNMEIFVLVVNDLVGIDVFDEMENVFFCRFQI